MWPLYRKRALSSLCRLRWYFNPFFKVYNNSGNVFKIKVIAELYKRRKLHSPGFSDCNLAAPSEETCNLYVRYWKNFVLLTLMFNLLLGTPQGLIQAIIFSNKINIYFSVSRVEVHFRSHTSFWETIAIIPIPLCFVSWVQAEITSVSPLSTTPKYKLYLSINNYYILLWIIVLIFDLLLQIFSFTII